MTPAEIFSLIRDDLMCEWEASSLGINNEDYPLHVGMLGSIEVGEGYVIVVSLHGVVSFRGDQPDLPSTALRTYLCRADSGEYELIRGPDAFSVVLAEE